MTKPIVKVGFMGIWYTGEVYILRPLIKRLVLPPKVPIVPSILWL